MSSDNAEDLEHGVPAAELRLLAQRLAALLGVVHDLANEGPGRSGLALRIGEHLGVDPLGLPVLAEQVPPYQL
jgi:hypothetical protein